MSTLKGEQVLMRCSLLEMSYIEKHDYTYAN